MKTAASYEITKIRVNPAGGEIEELYINHEKVDMGSDSLQDNKEVTIDVSAYTEPVEITPTEGKNGMAKVTVTLSNIPSGGYNFYYWYNEDADSNYYTLIETPTTDNKAYVSGYRLASGGSAESISATGENTITVNSVVYTRDSTGDFSLTV